MLKVRNIFREFFSSLTKQKAIIMAGTISAVFGIMYVLYPYESYEDQKV